uniref:Uncharacterized protein n=1 Tax=uncultured marine virus TaxID=186617 RepID=A0A0F7L8Y9_9VIRU|nr:hypothetical protein [uncultured marine virus]
MKPVSARDCSMSVSGSCCSSISLSVQVRRASLGLLRQVAPSSIVVGRSQG